MILATVIPFIPAILLTIRDAKSQVYLFSGLQFCHAFAAAIVHRLWKLADRNRSERFTDFGSSRMTSQGVSVVPMNLWLDYAFMTGFYPANS